MNVTRNKVATFQKLLALAFVIVSVGCGGSRPALKPLVLDGSKPLTDVTKDLGANIEAVSSTTRRLAPELVSAAEAYVKRASQSNTPDEQKRLIVIADACARNAEAVAATLATSRTVRFPGDRSIGRMSVAKDGKTWREMGAAQGDLNLEAEEALMLHLDAGTIGQHLDLLSAMPPGTIQYLAISREDLVEADYKSLPRIIGLRQLSLFGTDCDDAMLAIVSECYGLEHLNLMGTKVTDAGMEMLKVLPALREIAVGDTAVTDRGLFVITKLPAIESVILRQNEITDVGVDYLRRVPRLTRLWIGGPSITDQSVPLISELKQLKELSLFTTHITDRAQRELGKALPECRIDVVYADH